MSYVIGICGPAGAGKSSLVKALLTAISDSTAIYIDDYQRITREPMNKIRMWREQGADFDAFSIPLISDHLERLKAGQEVIDPLTLKRIEPAAYILFETHFGRAHGATGQHIDFLVWIDVPADIALVRNLRDLIKPMLPGGGVEPDQQRLSALDAYLVKYDEIRQLRELQRERVSPDADVIVDGGEPWDIIASRLSLSIMKQLT